MVNPWMEIELADYEKHMSNETVYQLQSMNQIMKNQLYTYPADSVMILGIAGGNGLEHVNCSTYNKVCLASINPCSAEVKNPAVRKLKSMHLAI